MKRIDPTAWKWVAALALLAVGPLGPAADAPSVRLQKIKYADLGKYVRGLAGKVVVVDFWAEY